MSYNLVKACKNVYSINRFDDCGKKTPTIEEIQSFTLIVQRGNFVIQGYNPTKDERIFYIQKYEVILTQKQAEEFCKSHPTENFLLVDNEYASVHDMWFYVTSEPDNLTVHCFHACGGATMSLFAILHNEPNRSFWQKPAPLKGSKCRSIKKYDRYRGNPATEPRLTFVFDNSYQGTKDHGHLINLKLSSSLSSVTTEDILRDCLRLTGKTRIVHDEDGYHSGYYKYKVDICPDQENLPILERYGIKKPTNDRWRYRYGGDFMWKDEFFDSTIPQEDWDRVTKRIEAKLQNQDKNDESAYAKLLQTSVLVITAPIPGHRRPSFHLICGFRANHITEIVELARGELLMEDMTPVNIYGLFTDGKYRLLMYDMKTELRDRITSDAVEIDPESFNIWAQERSLHPTLLTKLSESYFEKIELETVKLLNKIPFGSLLIDQLIAARKPKLAIKLAEYITVRAYDFNVVCGRLQDLFPECNGDETSLYKILNISRATAKYLFDGAEDVNIDEFVTKYKAIHHFGGNMTMTDVIMGNVETYMSLYRNKEHRFKLTWGDRTFDFLNYPKLAKQVVRMRKKIVALKEDGTLSTSKFNDVENKYDEIVRAYCAFLDYSTFVAPAAEKEFWHPEHLKIFVEFSLTGTPDHPLDPVEEVSSREEDANKALGIYQEKANEKLTSENEQKFQFRRVQINKLRSYADLDKQELDFKGYVVIAPSQIYGRKVVGSVEKEAADLDHCLFRCYTERIISGHYTTMWLRVKGKEDESLITIGITEDGRIEQTRGKNNRDATPAEAKAIAAWAKSKAGMITFRSEGSDVQPGGWPGNVAVPALPKPDKDWLKKLSLTHQVQ